MLVKEYNKNTYVKLRFNDFLNKKHFYEELIRIKFNKKLLVIQRQLLFFNSFLFIGK